MPTYVYACKNCGYGFEQHQSFSDDALVTCPQCGQDTLRKVFNSVGIVFKGSGFYKTDSRSGSTGSGTVAAGDATPTASTTSESTSGASGTSAPSAPAAGTATPSSSTTPAATPASD